MPKTTGYLMLEYNSPRLAGKWLEGLFLLNVKVGKRYRFSMRKSDLSEHHDDPPYDMAKTPEQSGSDPHLDGTPRQANV
jgi:hypothetical protein